MKLAFVYAGQGSQKPGMGKDLYESYPTFRQVFDSASLDFDLIDTCFNADDAVISNTRYTQPCMVAFAIGVTNMLKDEGITPSCCAGLSLGEYSALYASGALSQNDALSLVNCRGKIMQQATEGIDCKMIAILGASEELVRQAVDSAKDIGIVDAANFNCTGQIVIGGQSAAVDAAAAKAKELGAKRAIPLNVSGPFHTRLMEDASVKLAEKLAETSFAPMEIPVIFNFVGAPLPEGTTIPAALEKQIKSSVLFEQTILYMKSIGVDTVIEIGPGKVLSGFFKKTAPDITCYSIEDAESFKDTILAIKEG